MAAALHFLQGAAGTRQLCPVSRERLAVWCPLLETAPLLPGAPGFQPRGFLCRATLFSGALSPQSLCRPTSDRLLMPDVPQYLAGASSNTTGPAVLHMGSVLEALQGLQARLSCHGASGVPSPRTVASNHLKNVFRTSLPHTQGYQEAPMKRFWAFLLWLSIFPRSIAQLLNQPVSKPWETSRLSLAGSTYFVTLPLYLAYYNLYQIALCLLKWTIRIQL